MWSIGSAGGGDGAGVVLGARALVQFPGRPAQGSQVGQQLGGVARCRQTGRRVVVCSANGSPSLW